MSSARCVTFLLILSAQRGCNSRLFFFGCFFFFVTLTTTGFHWVEFLSVKLQNVTRAFLVTSIHPFSFPAYPALVVAGVLEHFPAILW